jgi:hypothetical protein
VALVLAAKAALEAGRAPLRPALLALLLDALAAFLRLARRRAARRAAAAAHLHRPARPA